jgi:Ca2+-transporting ATPase
MGLTTFLVAVVLLSFESRDQRRSIFNLEVLDDRTFLIATGISAAVIYLGTTFSGFQRILDTMTLSLNQWIICMLAGAGVVVASEIRKVFLRRHLRPGHRGRIAPYGSLMTTPHAGSAWR